MLIHFFHHISLILNNEDIKVGPLLENAMGNDFEELPEGLVLPETVSTPILEKKTSGSHQKW